MKTRRSVDKIFVMITAILVVSGFLLFMSALMGLRVRNDINQTSLVINQLAGIGIGVVAAVILSHIKYTVFKKYAFYLFAASIVVTALVFIPGIGIEHGGAKRWIALGPISFQPVEFLKFGFVVYFAALLSTLRSRINSFRDGILPITIILAIVATILLTQPDTGSFATILAAAIAMYLAAGGKVRYVFFAGIFGVAGVAILAALRPYVRSRIMTFLDPSFDPLGAGYQIQQALIAIGSGGLSGRGFGQSVQKFSYLPEPVGDSIFAVVGEEFGFIGATILIALFCFFMLRGLRIAHRSSNLFGGLLVVGIVIMIVAQSFVNIASMLGVLPLTGMPLIFVSHGGTALVFTLAMLGVVANVSRYQKIK